MLNLHSALILTAPVMLSACGSGPALIEAMQLTAVDMSERN
ncbi:MAG: hypothetical protein P8J17_07330 [Halioglobus sp.]|nr:hypothetical protein [Halioglobus sp.]